MHAFSWLQLLATVDTLGIVLGSLTRAGINGNEAQELVMKDNVEFEHLAR